MQDLATRALTITVAPSCGYRPPRRRVGADLVGPRTAALAALISVAEQASRDQPALAWDALAETQPPSPTSPARPPAARPSAAPSTCRNAKIQPPPDRDPHIDVNAMKLWIRASTDPAGSRNQIIPDPAHDRRRATETAVFVGRSFRRVSPGRNRPGGPFAARSHAAAPGPRRARHQRRHPDRARVGIHRHRAVGRRAGGRRRGRQSGRGEPDGHRCRVRRRDHRHRPGHARRLRRGTQARRPGARHHRSSRKRAARPRPASLGVAALADGNYLQRSPSSASCSARTAHPSQLRSYLGWPISPLPRSAPTGGWKDKTSLSRHSALSTE